MDSHWFFNEIPIVRHTFRLSFSTLSMVEWGMVSLCFSIVFEGGLGSTFLRGFPMFSHCVRLCFNCFRWWGGLLPPSSSTVVQWWTMAPFVLHCFAMVGRVIPLGFNCFPHWGGDFYLVVHILPL